MERKGGSDPRSQYRFREIAESREKRSWRGHGNTTHPGSTGGSRETNRLTGQETVEVIGNIKEKFEKSWAKDSPWVGAGRTGHQEKERKAQGGPHGGRGGNGGKNCGSSILKQKRL